MRESEKVKVKSLSCVQLLATPWTAAYQAPLSIGFFQARVLEWVPCHPRQEVVVLGFVQIWTDHPDGMEQLGLCACERGYL